MQHDGRKTVLRSGYLFIREQTLNLTLLTLYPPRVPPHMNMAAEEEFLGGLHDTVGRRDGPLRFWSSGKRATGVLQVLPCLTPIAPICSLMSHGGWGVGKGWHGAEGVYTRAVQGSSGGLKESLGS